MLGGLGAAFASNGQIQVGLIGLVQTAPGAGSIVSASSPKSFGTVMTTFSPFEAGASFSAAWSLRRPSVGKEVVRRCARKASHRRCREGGEDSTSRAVSARSAPRAASSNALPTMACRTAAAHLVVRVAVPPCVEQCVWL